MDKTFLITGGAGFVGSAFVEHILTTYPRSRVVVVDALTYAGAIDSLPHDLVLDSRSDRRLAFWYGNVRNGELMSTLIGEADIVVHFAAETHVTRSIFDNAVFFETDVLGTQTVANAIVKAQGRTELFIHVSSSEVYGTALTERMDETHPLNPGSPYASAKCGADRLVHSYHATYAIPAVIVRPFNLFGPRQHLEKLIPRFITSVLLGEPMTIHGEGTAARDFTYAEDLCHALDLILQAPRERVVGEVFNVASGQHHTIRDIAEDIRQIMGRPDAPLLFLPDRPGQVQRLTGDWSKINRVLGWRPHHDWRRGIEKTAAWYAANGAWWEKQMWARTIPIVMPDGRVVRH